MNLLKKRTISTSIVAMLLIGMAMILPSYAQPTTLYIDPASVMYDTSTPVGTNFVVAVKIADVTDMFAYEFKLNFNRTVLQLMSAVRPAGHFLEPVLDPASFFVPVWKINETVSGDQQTAHFGYTLLAPEVPVSGSGILVDLTFQILIAPPAEMGAFVSTPLDLHTTKVADGAAQPIIHTAVDGYFQYSWVPPAPTQYLSINPATTLKPAGAPIVGTANAFFDVFVDMNALPYDWWVVGVEFKLAYDPALIDFLGASVDPWLDGFGDIYMVPVTEGTVGSLAYLYTAVVLLPHSFPPSHWDNPIFGTGHLLELNFEVIHQEAFPWEGHSVLDLYDIKMSDKNADPAPFQPEQDGQVIVKGFIIGRQLDVYTQYPDPYGGQGPNMPSDMFWPQKEVELFANVTYNLWPVQSKLVAFEVHNPAGELVTILTAVSDTNGVAHVTFRIPWPCENPESLFGIWTIVATVDIASEVVTDTLQFHFDYLVRWISVTTDKTDYAHGETVKVTIEYQSYAIQHYDVVFTTVIHDELNYPIGNAAVGVTVGDLDMFLWCQYDPGTVEMNIPIPKYAAAGVATVHVNAYSDWPFAGGSPWVPEFTPAPEINILPV